MALVASRPTRGIVLVAWLAGVIEFLLPAVLSVTAVGLGRAPWLSPSSSPSERLATLPGPGGSRPLPWPRGGADNKAANKDPRRPVDSSRGPPPSHHRSSSSKASSSLPAQLHLRLAPPGLQFLNGCYTRVEKDLNGRARYDRVADQADGTSPQVLSGDDGEERRVHLYWHSSQWVLHYDLDPALNYDNYLGYSKVDSDDPRSTTGSWYLRQNKRWVASPLFKIVTAGVAEEEGGDEEGQKRVATTVTPAKLVPVLTAFLLDAVGTGMASVPLPFYIMNLGANAMQLGMVLAFNYLAQTCGCIVMGHVSDRYGRRNVILGCLLVSCLSLTVVSRAKSLVQVALGRILGGMMGGLVPLAQSCVADLCDVDSRPKFLGRIQACMGAGFVLGPLLFLGLHKALHYSQEEVLRLAAILPATALVYAFFFLKETKTLLGPGEALVTSTRSRSETLPVAVLLLVVNGFLLMYAFSTETIYAVLLKEKFGYGEVVMGLVLALNGVAVGLLQILFIKNLFAKLGKHVMLVLGNFLLSGGMLGLALIDNQVLHFFMFSVHVIGYAISDTALASLISRYSLPESQGRNLGLSHAAQSGARIISPLIAGTLYEKSKSYVSSLPVGALPYVVASVMPLLGMMVPTILYLRSVEAKRAAAKDKKDKSAP